MNASEDGGCGGVKIGEDESTTTFFFMDNEKLNTVSSSMSDKSNMFLRRRRRVEPDSKVDSSSPPVPTSESRKAFENIRQKVSAINNPYGEVNNNNVKIGGLHSTPATCVNGGSEPGRGDQKGDSGFIDQTGSGRSNSFYTSGRPDTINRSGIDTPPVRKLDTARSPVRHLHDAFTSASSKKKRLFESTSRHQVILFGVKFKIDDVIPLLVVAFVAITAIVTLTTLTGALKRAHVLPRMDPANQNGKYRSLKYAHEQKPAGQKQFDSGVHLSVHDDEGNRLGGKRASIKFAHDRIRATDDGANDVEDNLSVNDGDNYFDAADLLNTIKTLSPSVPAAIDEEKPSTHKSARIEKRRRVIMKKSRKSSPIQAYGQQASTSSAEVTKAELLDTVTNIDKE